MAHTISDIVSRAAGPKLDPPVVTSSAAPRNAGPGANVEAVTGASGDRTTLSTLGGVLNRSLQSAGALSSFRSDRVAELKTAVTSGAYQPDLGQVAHRVAQALRGTGQ